MSIANFRDKVIDDDIYETLFGNDFVGNKIKLSRALKTLGKQEILDFSHNALTNLDAFLDIMYLLSTCKLLDVSSNNISNNGNNWKTIILITKKIPSNGYICIANNPISGWTSSTELASLARTEYSLFKKIIWIKECHLKSNIWHSYLFCNNQTDYDVLIECVTENHTLFYNLYGKVQ